MLSSQQVNGCNTGRFGGVTERADKGAQWARVAARLRADIAEGRLSLGERIAGEIELAARYGVSRGVVQRALMQLRNEGLLYTVHGQGSYVASRPVLNTVTVGAADRVAARLPEDDERVALGMAPGVPLIVVTRPGADPEYYDAAVTIVRGHGQP